MGVFHFKQFSVDDSHCGMKTGTDAVLLGAWAEVKGFKTIVDAGCGSGIIALMAAQRNSEARIIAIDINAEACKDTQINVAASPWSERVEVVEGDILSLFPAATAHPLLIISNPPFFNEALRSPDRDRALARHGEEFGVGSLISLAAAKFDSPADSLAFIAPTERNDEIEFLLSLSRLSPTRKTLIYSRPGKASIRTLWHASLERPGIEATRTDTLYIRNADNELTPEYMALTSPFYLDK